MSDNTRYLFSELVKTNATYQKQLDSYLTNKHLNNDQFGVTYGYLDTDELLYELELTHSWFIKPDLSVIGHFSSTKLDNEFENRFGIEVRHYF